VVACGAGGAGTASEIALALKAGKPVVLLKDRPESKAFFRAIANDLVRTAETIEDAVKVIDSVLAPVRS
jgi:predicted Rossmann-fold nucleotide-binding protein